MAPLIKEIEKASITPNRFKLEKVIPEYYILDIVLP